MAHDSKEDPKMDLEDEKKQEAVNDEFRAKIFRDNPVNAKLLSMYLSYKTQMSEDDLMRAFALISKYRVKQKQDDKSGGGDHGGDGYGSGSVTTDKLREEKKSDNGIKPILSQEELEKNLLEPGGDPSVVFNKILQQVWAKRPSNQPRWQNRRDIHKQLKARSKKGKEAKTFKAAAAAVVAADANKSEADILRDAGFDGEIVTPEDGKKYEKSRDQYATSTYDDGEKMHPRMIVYPKKDENHTDIKIVLKFAREHSPQLKVMTRSGGHQYSGLSSGDKDTILIDIVHYDSKKIVEDNEGRLILTIEPNVSLGGMEPNETIITPDGEKQAAGLGQYLTSQGAALPYGMCSSVHIGGHVQSGGFGNILRGFGLTLDYCIGFKIILYNGEVMEVTKPEINGDGDGDEQKYDVYNNGGDDSKYAKNYDMYWAVMGGNPGSYGVVIEYTFNCIRNKDYQSSGFRFQCLYHKEKLRDMMYLYRSMMESDVTDTNLNDREIHPLPKDYDIVFTIVNARASPELPEFVDVALQYFPVIVFNGCYSNRDGKEYDSSYFDKFREIGKKNYRWGPEGYIETFNGKKDISEMMEEFVVLEAGWHREYDLPFNKRVRASRKRWDRAMVDSYVEAVDELFSFDSLFGGFRLASQLGLCGGASYYNDPQNKITSLARRDVTNMVIFDIFHPKGDFYFNKSEEIHKKLEKYWIGHDWSYLDENDVRFTWATFGGSDIKNDWQFYYGDKHGNSKIYQTLQRIKKQFDPINIFQNQFTIPLPDHEK